VYALPEGLVVALVTAGFDAFLQREGSEPVIS
jgi:hypothetical protein